MKNINNTKLVIKRAKSLKKKHYLKKIYTEFYNIFKNHSVGLPKGKKVEIGSGGGFLKEIIPEVITSDIIKLPNVDMCFSAEKIPFKRNSISAFYMLNVLHHIKNPEIALKEISRCLKKGGRLTMIEPYNSLWSRFIYKNFHFEIFNPKTNWKVQGKEPLLDANQAIPWIIFVRDRKIFEKIFPEFDILSIQPHTPFKYLISGGFSVNQLLPNFTYNFMDKLEKKIEFLNKYLGLFSTIVIEKG